MPAELAHVRKTVEEALGPSRGIACYPTRTDGVWRFKLPLDASVDIDVLRSALQGLGWEIYSANVLMFKAHPEQEVISFPRLYHVSPRRNTLSILKEGLLLGRRDQSTFPRLSLRVGGKVFFTDSLGNAAGWATHFTEPTAVFAVRLANTTSLYRDPAPIPSYYTKEAVPATQIQLVSDLPASASPFGLPGTPESSVAPHESR